MKEFDTRLTEANQDLKPKTIIDFDRNNSYSMKKWQ